MAFFVFTGSGGPWDLSLFPHLSEKPGKVDFLIFCSMLHLLFLSTMNPSSDILSSLPKQLVAPPTTKNNVKLDYNITAHKLTRHKIGFFFCRNAIKCLCLKETPSLRGKFSGTKRRNKPILFSQVVT